MSRQLKMDKLMLKVLSHAMPFYSSENIEENQRDSAQSSISYFPSTLLY